MRRAPLPTIRSGFSLVEVLVAFGIFTIFFLAITNVAISAGRVQLHSGNVSRATALADQAIEATRNIRDAGFANLTDGTYGLQISGGQYTFSGASDTVEIFSRSVTISTISSFQKRVDATVTWADAQKSNNAITVSTYLTNWRAPYLTTTSTTLVTSINPATVGASITFTATVTPTAATGTVSFYDGATQIGTGVLSAGIATYSTSALALGSHVISAVYPGDALYASSTSNTVTQIIGYNLPTVTTSTVSNVLTRTAAGGGNVTADGGDPVIERGVVWDTSPNPTIALTTKTLNGTGTGTFTSSITGLLPNRIYYLRAYATNSGGTAYGAEVSFTTLKTTVTFVGASSNGGTTVTIPTHQVGDLMIVFAYRDGNNTAPSLPSGWTDIGTAIGSAQNSSRLAYRIATATNDASGTWTNATGLVVHVYRGQNTSTPIGVFAEASANNSTTAIYPGLTLVQTDGSSWVAAFAGDRDTNTALETPPTGMVNRTNMVNGVNEVSGHGSNGGVTSWSDTSVVIGVSNSDWRTRTVEILSQ